jgi:three-Cys-motif partner protein
LFSLKTERTIYEILQILGKSLLDKTPINQLLNKSDCQNVKERDCMLLLFKQIKRNTSEIGVKNAKTLIADYNNAKDICTKIKSEINPKNLNLILIDPTDCSVPFELIKNLKTELNNVDFIINIATGTDFNRNIPMAFQNEERAKKYGSFLGNDSFFTDFTNRELCKVSDFQKLRENFRIAYQNSLMKIGLKYFSLKSVNHYYDILFAAGHPQAIKFWQQATKIEYDGQRTLF